VEDGVGVVVSEQSSRDPGEKDRLQKSFGRAPRFPIPQESYDRIMERVLRLAGTRDTRGLWDALRDALIEARFLRGIVYGPESPSTDSDSNATAVEP
jgi:hypothetical protein